jgi:hypothetical protein
VRCGTLVLGRPGDGIFTYSAGRRLESENNPGKDQTSPSRATRVLSSLPGKRLETNKTKCQPKCVTAGPACVIAWRVVLRNTGGGERLVGHDDVKGRWSSKSTCRDSFRRAKSGCADTGRTCTRDTALCPCPCDSSIDPCLPTRHPVRIVMRES